MRTLDAVNAGYDEITHINFATMQAMPDEVVAKSNTTLRLTGPGKYFKDVDFNAEPMQHGHQDAGREADHGRSDAGGGRRRADVRGGQGLAGLHGLCRDAAAGDRARLQVGPIPLPEGTTREDAQGSVKHMVEYVAVLRKAGVPIVAGTDGSGHGDGARARALRRGRHDAGRGAGDRDHRSPRATSRPTSAPDRSRSARRPTCCWSTATPKRTSATCATSTRS